MASTMSQSHPVSSSLGSSFIDPALAVDNFSSQFDLEDPIAAISDYARVMREHTQHQMNLATRAASRRPAETVSAMNSLSAQSSIESTDSRGAA